MCNKLRYTHKRGQVEVPMMSLCLFACSDDKEEDNGGNSGKGFYVTYRGVKVEVGKDSDGVIDALGESLSISELGDCGGLGAQIKYTYPSIAVYVLENSAGYALIDGIEIYDDSVSTPQGVYIGMSADEAKAKLDGAKESGNALTVIDGNYYLKVKLDGGKVSEIYFGTDSGY